MSAAKQKQVMISGAFALGVVAVLLVGYLMLISPKKSKAADLQRETATTQSQLTIAQAVARHPGGRSPVGAPDLFRLSKAMPDAVDTAGAILDLAAAGKATGVSVDGLTTSDPVPATTGGFELVPITANLLGTYSQLTNFLARVRRLVGVRDGKIVAHGRLFGVDGIQFVPNETDSQVLKATVKFQTYVYSTAAAAAAAPTTTTPAPTNDLSAAGANG